MYRRAIVDEKGDVMFWIDDVRPDIIMCILDSHPEWTVKCVEIESEVRI